MKKKENVYRCVVCGRPFKAWHCPRCGSSNGMLIMTMCRECHDMKRHGGLFGLDENHGEECETP